MTQPTTLDLLKSILADGIAMQDTWYAQGAPDNVPRAFDDCMAEVALLDDIVALLRDDSDLSRRTLQAKANRFKTMTDRINTRYSTN